MRVTLPPPKRLIRSPALARSASPERAVPRSTYALTSLPTSTLARASESSSLPFGVTTLTGSPCSPSTKARPARSSTASLLTTSFAGPEMSQVAPPSRRIHAQAPFGHIDRFTLHDALARIRLSALLTGSRHGKRTLDGAQLGKSLIGREAAAAAATRRATALAARIEERSRQAHHDKDSLHFVVGQRNRVTVPCPQNIDYTAEPDASRTAARRGFGWLPAYRSQVYEFGAVVGCAPTERAPNS